MGHFALSVDFTFHQIPMCGRHGDLMLSTLETGSSGLGPISRKTAPDTFRVRKAIFNFSVSKIWEVYTHETSCLKRNSFDVTNMWIKWRCNHQVWRFCYNFPGAKTFRTFKKRLPALIALCSWARHYARKASLDGLAAHPAGEGGGGDRNTPRHFMPWKLE